jgi:hypothetical protein
MPLTVCLTPDLSITKICTILSNTVGVEEEQRTQLVASGPISCLASALSAILNYY